MSHTKVLVIILTNLILLVTAAPRFQAKNYGKPAQFPEEYSEQIGQPVATPLKMTSVALSMTRLLKEFVPSINLLTFEILLGTTMASTVAVIGIQTGGFAAMILAHPIIARLFPLLLQFLGANPDGVYQFMTSLSFFISTSIASVPTALLNTIIRTWIPAFVSILAEAAMEGYNQ